MAYNYRCTKSDCRKRKTLRHPMEWYIRRPKCPACGRDSLAFDPHVRNQTLRRTCKCNGIMYPHRAGTILSEYEFCHQLTLDDVLSKLQEQNPNEDFSHLTGTADTV